MSSLLGMNGGGSIDLTQGLVAHYLLNNNADDSFGSFDGTAIGGVDFQGDSAKFDGINDKVITGVTDSGTTSTISLWFKGTGASEMIARSSYNRTLNHGTQVYLSSTGHVSIYRTDTTVWTVVLHSTTVVNDNLLHHILYTTSPSGTLLYVDGVLEASTTDTVSPSTSLVWELGHNQNNTWLNGKLSNFRVYNDSKDQSFITELYAEGYYPKPLPLPTTAGLLAHYPLTGTAEDTTGNYDGIEVGNTYVVDGEFGSVASFDGISNMINLGNNFNTIFSNSFSLSLWANPTGGGGIFGKGNAIAGEDFLRLYVRTSNPYVRFSLGNSSTVVDVDSAIDIRNTGFRHLVVMWKQGVGIYIYLDGQLLNTTLTSETFPFTNSFITTLGASNYVNSNGTYYEFLGRLSRAHLYNIVLTQQEITDIYNYEKNFRPIDIDDGLVAYYPLAKNSLDNYGIPSEYDGVDTSVTYDGTQAIIIGNITFPTVPGFVEMYYTQDGVKNFTTVEINVFTAGTLKNVRKYSKALTAEQKELIGY